MMDEELILNRYKPLAKAGEGGFGTVIIAWDPRIQRKVAIKTIELSEADVRRASLPGADAVTPFDDEVDRIQTTPGQVRDHNSPVTTLAHVPGLDEARTAAKLTDSRIVGVYDFEVRDPKAYIIMEYVEGITLTQLLASYEDRLTLDVLTAVFDAIAGALSVAHKAGVLHLDIKPDNILINEDGQVKVTDFGLATLADASGQGSAGGGTIGYMPLEQMRRQVLDARSDEWSLAAVAYEMLTGENQFFAPDLAEAEKAIENAELILPSLCWDDMSEELDDIVFRALDPDPEMRYESVEAFAKELDACLGQASEGVEQLAWVVQEALGRNAADGEESQDFANGTSTRDSWVTRLATKVGNVWKQHWPLICERTFEAMCAAYLMWFAVMKLYPSAEFSDNEQASLVALIALLVAACVGALVPFVAIGICSFFLGFVFVAAGEIAAGIAVALGGFIWAYALYRGKSVKKLQRQYEKQLEEALDEETDEEINEEYKASKTTILVRLVGVLVFAGLVAVLIITQLRSDYIPSYIVELISIASTIIFL